VLGGACLGNHSRDTWVSLQGLGDQRLELWIDLGLQDPIGG
jgi:hypothetical protein